MDDETPPLILDPESEATEIVEVDVADAAEALPEHGEDGDG